ncbi:MAG: prepilin peptidase [Candidatus Acidiferrales bacterium]
MFGLIIGSFLNVCISRLPQGKSVVRPSSRCPRCGKSIRPYDNIPVLSYFFLAGKCRACKMRISPVYPAVELLTGLLFLGCYLLFGTTIECSKWAVFASLMIVLAFTDMQERTLPDVVNLFGFVLGIFFSLAATPVHGPALKLSELLFAYPPSDRVLSLLNALAGAALGSGILIFVPMFYFWLKGVYLSFRRGSFRLKGLPWQKGMGMGDVKMMAMVGAYLGIWMTILTILVGSLLGSILGFGLIAALFLFGWKRNAAERASRMGLGNANKLRFVLATRYQLPFGTYLSIAALLVVFFGTPVVTWYQSLFVMR